jgi:hypothetical protein
VENAISMNHEYLKNEFNKNNEKVHIHLSMVDEFENNFEMAMI